MVMIRIKDVVDSASSYEDGTKVLDTVRTQLRAGEIVELSFDGIPAVTSAFVNSALIPLLESDSFDVLRNRLLFTHTTRFINDVIRRRFAFVVKRTAHAPR